MLDLSRGGPSERRVLEAELARRMPMRRKGVKLRRKSRRLRRPRLEHNRIESGDKPREGFVSALFPMSSFEFSILVPKLLPLIAARPSWAHVVARETHRPGRDYFARNNVPKRGESPTM